MTGVRIVHITSNADTLLGHYTKVCYSAFEKKDPLTTAKRVRNCIKLGHIDISRHGLIVFDLDHVEHRLVTHLIECCPFLRQTRRRTLNESLYGYDTDPNTGHYRVSGNFQCFLDLRSRLNQPQCREVLKLLEPVYDALIQEVPNLFLGGDHLIGVDPQPIGHCRVGEADVELWSLYLDDTNPIHSYATWHCRIDEGSQRQHIRHLFLLSEEEEGWEGVLVESTRYVNQSKRKALPPPVTYLSDEANVWHTKDGRRFTSPQSLRNLAQQEFDRVWNTSQEAYRRLIAMDVKKEDARAVLPLMKETRLFYTGRMPVIKNYLNLRREAKSQPHMIQQVAAAMTILGQEHGGERWDRQMEGER